MLDISVSPAVMWAVVGLLFLIAEVATVSFVLCFIGMGALIVALATWMGLTSSISSQLLVFSVSSLLLLLLLRKAAKKLFAGHADAPPDYEGQRVNVTEDIPVGGEGAIHYRGSTWIAFTDEPRGIPRGTVVQIEKIDGIRVKVKLVE